MAKLSRIFQNIFGSSAGTDQIAVFGSKFAGSPAFTTNPATAQSLSNFLAGWFQAVIATPNGNSPCIEDMNALFNILTYQIAYGFQAGVPEWDSSTIYFTGSLATSIGTGLVYVSLQDSNVGNALTNTSYWQLNGAGIRSVSSNYSIAAFDETILGNASSAAFAITLPTAVGIQGQTYVLKKTDSSFNAVSINTASSQTIDGASSTSLNTQNECLTIVSDGANWQTVQRLIPSNWVSYTPTFVGLGTPTSVQMYYSRDGADLLLRGNFTIGTPTAVNASIGLPSGLAIDSVTVGNTYVGGQLTQNVISGTRLMSMLIATGATSITMARTENNTSNDPLVPETGSAAWPINITGSMWARVPIAGWGTF